MDKDELAAYHAAVRFLSAREHCAAELAEKLARRGFAPACVGTVLARLRRENYLSEERFAEFFIRSRMQRGETPWLAAEKARLKGGEHAAVAEAQRDAEAGFDEERACRQLLRQRDPQRRYRDDERQWRRQARFLQNKGYRTATILRVLKED